MLPQSWPALHAWAFDPRRSIDCRREHRIASSRRYRRDDAPRLDDLTTESRPIDHGVRPVLPGSLHIRRHAVTSNARRRLRFAMYVLVLLSLAGAAGADPPV